MFYPTKRKENRKQVNVRIPAFIIKHVDTASEMLGMTKNDYYVYMLYDWMLTKGIHNVKREK